MVEGLLPEPHNSGLLTLLYRLAEWHALAKLRMHTEITLEHLEKATVTIGKELRSFRDTIAADYTCKELPGEVSRRTRRQKKKKEHGKKNAQAQVLSTPESAPSLPPSALPPKNKLLNLLTYKLHALGDYVRTIRLFGTTDSYSTQIVRPLRWFYQFDCHRIFRENLHIG